MVYHGAAVGVVDAAHEDSAAALGVSHCYVFAVGDLRPVAWDLDVVLARRFCVACLSFECFLAHDGHVRCDKSGSVLILGDVECEEFWQVRDESCIPAVEERGDNDFEPPVACAE